MKDVLVTEGDGRGNELGHEKNDATLSSASCSTHALNQSNRRFECVKTNNQIHTSDIQAFFADGCGDEDVVTTETEISDDFFLQFLIDSL